MTKARLPSNSLPLPSAASGEKTHVSWPAIDSWLVPHPAMAACGASRTDTVAAKRLNFLIIWNAPRSSVQSRGGQPPISFSLLEQVGKQKWAEMMQLLSPPAQGFALFGAA